MIIYILTNFLFQMLRGLFIAYIIRRISRRDSYGLYALIIYFSYIIFQSLFPVFLLLNVFLAALNFIITSLLYAFLFRMFTFRLKKRLTSLPLDIYTHVYEHMILFVILSVLSFSIIFVQALSMEFSLASLILIFSAIIFFAGFVYVRDLHAKSHVIIRIGKETFTYQIKLIDPRAKIIAYKTFYSSDRYQIDFIAKVTYRQEKNLRYDYVYALKTPVDTFFDGYTHEDIPYQEHLDALKQYQFVKLVITNGIVKSKRIK